MKAHYPKEFWKATLNHNQSHYRSWVHKYEAERAGVYWLDHTLSRNDKSIYTKARNKSNTEILKNYNISSIKQLKKTGYWNTTSLLGEINFFPDCYGFKTKDKFRFRGIIANLRVYRNFQCNAFIGVGIGKYIEIHFPKKCLGYMTQEMIGIEGYGSVKTEEPLIIECKFENQLNAF